jgi:hypothetical protein
MILKNKNKTSEISQAVETDFSNVISSKGYFIGSSLK